MPPRPARHSLRTRFRRWTAATLAVCLQVLPAGAGATSLKDIQVGIRGVEFLADPPRGQVEVAIIGDPHNKASIQDAQSIIGWLGAAKGGKVEFVPTMTDVRGLEKAPPMRVAIVAAGMEAHFAAILDYARRNNTLTITADLACVKSGNCVLGVATDPNVEVIVSRQASTTCGVDFVRAFRMMVKEY
jgi:hypothetical protein